MDAFQKRKMTMVVGRGKSVNFKEYRKKKDVNRQNSSTEPSHSQNLLVTTDQKRRSQAWQYMNNRIICRKQLY